jgi:hypothetical protein
VTGLPCTVSVPNLKTDRLVGLAWRIAALNVRRLMYQSLIWPMDLGDHARCLGAAFDTENPQGSANALIDGVRRYAEFHRDFLR